MTISHSLYPLKCRPLFKTRIWGGRRLAGYFGKPLPPDQLIGESWELADLPQDKSLVENGPLAGQSLTEVARHHEQSLYGQTGRWQSFPLLIKFIDAQDVLSVQVHPDADTCRRTGRGEPKTECWYIVDAAPGAVIYKGLKPGVTRKTLAVAIKAGQCEPLLERVEVHPGECHFIPSGTCHAIGAGTLIAEIQQPSDTTYRLYDWNRIDAATGKPRQLHIEEGLESVRFDLPAAMLTVRSEGRLVEAPEFQVDKLSRPAGGRADLPGGQTRALVFLAGQGTITAATGDPVSFRPGDTVVIPAACSVQIAFDHTGDCLVATFGNTRP